MINDHKSWSDEEVAILIKEYAICSSVKDLAKKLGRSLYSIKEKARSLGVVRKNRLEWNSVMDKILIENYPIKETADVAAILGIKPKQAYNRAKRLGLHKDLSVFIGLSENGRFAKGHAPFNKGMKQSEFMSEEMIISSARTRFKKGNIPHNTKNIGHEHFQRGGIIAVKTENGFVAKHRLLWEKTYGPIPPKHVIRFKNGNSQDIRIENLELVSFSNNMKRNSICNYSPEIRTAIRSIANINRRIKKYEQANNRQTE